MSVGPVSRLGAGREFDVIRRILADYAAAAALPPAGGASDRQREDAGAPGVRVGPGDDCAVLDNGVVISVDMSVEDVHFRRAWLSDEEIGYRAAMAALSDVAAMAATPVGMLVSVATAATGGGQAAEVMRGAGAAARAIGAPLLGGDVTRSPGPLIIDVVALGHASSPVLRSGARAGDGVYVTGRLGGAAAALEAWLAGREPCAAGRAAFASPRARTAEARWLAERAPLHALIDLSDGLAGDAPHIAAASEVCIVIDCAALPIHPAVLDRLRAGDAANILALGGGEEYELLIAGDDAALAALVEPFHAEFGVPLTRIGNAETGTGVQLRDAAGHVAPLELSGYRHFEGTP